MVVFRRGLLLGLAAIGIGLPLAVAAEEAAPASLPSAEAGIHSHTGRANFKGNAASAAAKKVADWIVDSGDNHSLPFAIVDKVEAKIFVFESKGVLRGTGSVLLGLARGDDTVPGIGSRKLSTILPEERTTPAGRFVASLDRNLRGEEVLWVDYDSAISLHRVITSKPEERRLQRLNSPSPLDNRISYGCINVSVGFYDKVVSPAFTGTFGVVYVLPETRPLTDVFALYDVDKGQKSTVTPPPL